MISLRIPWYSPHFFLVCCSFFVSGFSFFVALTKLPWYDVGTI
jgi:hypothetical protein